MPTPQEISSDITSQFNFLAPPQTPYQEEHEITTPPSLLTINQAGQHEVKYYFLSAATELSQSIGYDIRQGVEADISINQSMEYRRFEATTTNQKAIVNLVLGNSTSDGYTVFFKDVVSNLTFVTAGVTAATADINIGQVTVDIDGNGIADHPDVLAYTKNFNPSEGSWPPTYAWSTNYLDADDSNNKAHGDLWFNTQPTLGWGSTSIGSIQINTVLHELGHSLGLKHPASNSPINNTKYTIMVDAAGQGPAVLTLPGMITYVNGDPQQGVSGFVAPSGLQMYDILALQNIFKTRNYTVRADTPTTYKEGQGFGATVADGFIYTIWDGGGIDWMDASGYADKVRIDLRQGEFSSIGKALNTSYEGVRGTGLVDNNVGIAFHTVIENAKGTSGGDYLVGNAWDNTLEGGAGADLLFGDGVVFDARIGFRGDVTGETDAYVSQRAQGNEWVPSAADGSGDDVLTPGIGTDLAYGGKGDDTFTASAHVDAATGNQDHLEGDLYHGGGYIWGGLPENRIASTLIPFADDGIDTVDYSGVDFSDDNGIGISLGSRSFSFAQKWSSALGAYVQDGQPDALVSIERFILTAHDDKIFVTGDTGSFLNKVDGGDGIDALDAHDSAASILLNIDITREDPDDVPVDGANIIKVEIFKGSTYDDIFRIGDGEHIAHTIDGNGGVDTVDYSYALNKLDINLLTGIAHHAYDQTNDTLSDIRNATGSAFDDIITGNDENNVLDGGAGADTLDGGLGDDTFVGDVGNDVIDGGGEIYYGDTVDYNAMTSGIYFYQSSSEMTVQKLGLTGQNDPEDTLVNIEKVIGTGKIDYFSGLADFFDTDSYVELDGGAGRDVYKFTTAFGQEFGSPNSHLSYGNYYITDTQGGTVEIYDAYSSAPEYYASFYPDFDGVGLTLSYIQGGGSRDIGVGFIRSAIDSGEGITRITLQNVTFDAKSLFDWWEDHRTYVDQYGQVQQARYTVQQLAANVTPVPGGTAGDDAVNGTPDDDELDGGDGNDTLGGGTGNDGLFGGFGDDIYDFSEGDGQDVITETAGNDTIRFDSTVAAASVAYSQNGDDLLISYGAGGSVITVTDFFASASGQIEQVVFSDSTVHDISYILQQINGGSGTITGTSGDDTLVGGTGDQTLYGLEGSDTLDGGAGADMMVGGTGNDTYFVDNAGDLVIEGTGAGTDIVRSSISYTLAANVEQLILTGTDNLNGTGNARANVLTGNSGDNTLDGKGNWDTMSGGLGDDTYVVNTAYDSVIENADEGTDTVLSSATYTLSANVENLTLTGTANIKGTGNDLNNTLTGNSGNNSLNGGSGADVLIGGLGNDTYFIDDAGDVVTENASEGTDTVKSGISYVLGDNLENLTLTGTANIDGTGNAAVNTLTGNAGNNTLDGGAGADKMVGGLGDDSYYVDDAGDVVVDSGGIDTVYASVSYTLTGGIENLVLIGETDIDGSGNSLANTITGNAWNNNITGSGGADILYGMGGQDTLNGNGGIDTLAGGTGSDTYIVSSATDVILEEANQGTDTVQSSVNHTLAANVENLVLTGTNSIKGTGNELDNVITGNSGDNSLDGLAGNDTMAGGLGNDTYFVNSSGDEVTENLDAGTDTVKSSITWTLGNNLENLTLTGSAAINGTGNALDNTITGNSAVNILSGLDGNDTLTGQGAADQLLGGSGIDVLSGNGGADTLDGGTGGDTMSGGAGNDLYIVDDAGDILLENLAEGTDTVQASVSYTLSDNVENLILTGTAALDGTGNDLDNVITGNSAANAMTGKLGNDTYIVDNAGDSVIENLGEGIDTVKSSISHTLSDNVENLTLTGSAAIDGNGNGLDNVLTGNSGVNVLNGLDGLDTFFGGGGKDTIDGGDGNDVLYGQGGADTLTGGLGADVFGFEAATAYGAVDKVTDFSTAQGDVLDLRDLLAGIYDPLTMNLTDFVDMTDNGTDSFLKVDRDGAGTGFGFTQIATLTGVTGLTDEAALVTNGNLLVA
ncbi:MAG TPA: M10 family metallopeptidase C-terminal domain-containing protein [Bryobacteraceae bacterium]|nr:M10 family metallopeptidase C-terminal domain-containing protein [Bryobacteraceae bacterium]